MARMLQALKNLEARTPRPAGGMLAHLAEPAAPKPREARPTPEPTPPPKPESTPKPAGQAPPPPATTLRPAPSAEPDVVARLLDARDSSPKAAQRAPSQLESVIRRTLSDPARLPPIRQMADRLLADARHSASRTLLLAGVGQASTTHEALLYAGALLAEPAGSVLLVDADIQRRTLTKGLECSDAIGLGELLASRDSPRSLCQPTSVGGLSLLPAGRIQAANLSAAGSRLGELLHELAGDFKLVLVDGGRTAELSAATLARLTDATYLVVKLGAVEAAEAQVALRDLRAAGARVLGCIAT